MEAPGNANAPINPKFQQPPSRTTHGHLTDVLTQEGGEFDQKGLSVGGKFEPCPGGVGHLNRKYELELEVSSPASGKNGLFLQMVKFKNRGKKRSSNAVQIFLRLSSAIFRFYSLNSHKKVVVRKACMNSY